jgi:hypothetical protein
MVHYMYEITLIVICEMYNFVICKMHDLIFILWKFTYEITKFHIWNGFHIWNFFFICEMYNFVICEIYDLIFIYENSHMKLRNFTYEMDFIYEISFSYVNCIISYITWFSYMKIHIWTPNFTDIWNGFHIWTFFFHMWIV